MPFGRGLTPTTPAVPDGPPAAVVAPNPVLTPHAASAPLAVYPPPATVARPAMQSPSGSARPTKTVPDDETQPVRVVPRAALPFAEAPRPPHATAPAPRPPSAPAPAPRPPSAPAPAPRPPSAPAPAPAPRPPSAPAPAPRPPSAPAPAPRPEDALSTTAAIDPKVIAQVVAAAKAHPFGGGTAPPPRMGALPDASATPFRAQARTGPPVPPQLALGVERYAELCAMIGLAPGRAAETAQSFGLPDMAAFRAIDDAWQARFRADPALEQRWRALVADVRRRLGGGG